MGVSAGGQAPNNIVDNRKTNKRSIQNRQDTNIPYIPPDQYLCPDCKNIPELVNIHSDNYYVEFKCKKDGNITLKLKEYFEKLNNSEFIYYNYECSGCKKIQKNSLRDGIFKFCYICNKNYCFQCYKNTSKHTDYKADNDRCINVNEINVRCPVHFEEAKYTRFCSEDKENVCEKYSNKKHKNHEIKNFFEILEEDKQIIREKIENLEELIKFNKLILNTYERFPDNYFHRLNVLVLSKSIKAEKSRNPDELDNIFKELERTIKLRNNAIQEFNNKYKEDITGNEEKLILRKKGLTDCALEILSRVKFFKLKEIDLSFNKIKNIEYLKNYYSAFLEYLSLNDNEIEDITTLSHMILTNLKELNLQNNRIKKIEPLEKVEMPELKLLRIENNDLQIAMEGMKKVVQKFSKQIVYVPLTFNDFNKKYEVNITKDTIKIDFMGKRGGNIILRDLEIILPENNELEELSLTDNEIDDIETLSRIYLPKVKKIDLSFNKIIRIDPLTDLRPNNLKTIYLNDNNISDISPLKNVKFHEKPGKVTIENNNIIKNEETEEIINELKLDNIEVCDEDNN